MSCSRRLRFHSLAILGILFNGLAVLRLKKGISLNEKVVMLHLLEDVLGWTAILVGSIVMLFFHLPVLDPLSPQRTPICPESAAEYDQLARDRPIGP